MLHAELLHTAGRLRPRTAHFIGKVIFPMNLGSGEMLFLSERNNGVEPDVYKGGNITERLIKY